MQQRGRPSDSLKSPYLHSRSAVGVAVARGGHGLCSTSPASMSRSSRAAMNEDARLRPVRRKTTGP